jgi:hypothetical protein
MAAFSRTRGRKSSLGIAVPLRYMLFLVNVHEIKEPEQILHVCCADSAARESFALFKFIGGKIEMGNISRDADAQDALQTRHIGSRHSPTRPNQVTTKQ